MTMDTLDGARQNIARADGRALRAPRRRPLAAASCLVACVLHATVAAQDSTSNAAARLNQCAAATALGAIAGDVAGGPLRRTGTGTAYFTLRVREESTQTRDLRAVVQLTPPANAAYDLQVRCASCAGAVLGIARPGEGAPATVRVTRADAPGDDTFSVVIEILDRGGDRRGPWLLDVTGNRDVQVARGGAVRCP